jgi:hypothetical protein
MHVGQTPQCHLLQIARCLRLGFGSLLKLEGFARFPCSRLRVARSFANSSNRALLIGKP